MTAAFCERLGWYDLEALIAKVQVRSSVVSVGAGVRMRSHEVT